jgi:aspartate aminotransferase
VKLSRVARRVGHSGTLAVDERMQQLRSRGHDIVSLGAGQLDSETPGPVCDAGVRAIQEGRTRYTAVAGTPSLIEAVRAKFARENGIDYSADEVMVAAGAKAALFHALFALVDPEDVVIVPTPGWPSYASMIQVLGAHVAPARTEPAAGYKLTMQILMDTVTSAKGRARGLVLNSPHNPTGAVYSRAELVRLAEVAKGEGLWVLSDEIYEHLIYDGAFTSVAALPGMRESTVTVNSVSKTFAMTGWRIGYAGGPRSVIQAMVALQSHTSGNPCSISQEAAEAALRLSVEGDPRMRDERMRLVATLRGRRDLACRELAGIPGVAVTKPEGAFYVYADFSRYFGREVLGRRIQGSSDLAEVLVEQAGVAVVPGAVFGDDRSLRLSIATSSEELAVALQRIRRALAGETRAASPR